MKKILFMTALIMVAACAQSTKPENGLTRMDREPENCEFLYNIKASVGAYDIDDAYDFLEQRIVEEDGFGDTYFISDQNIIKKPGAVLGPKNTYKFKAKVYNCKK